MGEVMTATLTGDKPLSLNIAAYIGQFALIEMDIQHVFEKAIGGSGTWADCILNHVQSISTRLDIIEDFLRNCRGETKLAKDFLPLVPRIRKSITYRNKLAHSVFANMGAEVVIISNMFARKKNFKMEKITAKMVLDEYHSLEQLQFDILRALDALPPGFPTKIQRGP